MWQVPYGSRIGSENKVPIGTQRDDLRLRNPAARTVTKR